MSSRRVLSVAGVTLALGLMSVPAHSACWWDTRGNDPLWVCDDPNPPRPRGPDVDGPPLQPIIVEDSGLFPPPPRLASPCPPGQVLARNNMSHRQPLPSGSSSPGDTAPERLREASAAGFHLLHKSVSPMALRTTPNATNHFRRCKPLGSLPRFRELVPLDDFISRVCAVRLILATNGSGQVGRQPAAELGRPARIRAQHRVGRNA
jgi:hypothetical protein